MPLPSFLTPQLLATAAMLAWGLAPDGVASALAPGLRETLRCDLLSKADYERMEHGYYEQILDAGRTLGEWDEGRGKRGRRERERPRPEDAPFDAGELALAVADVREFVLKPNLSIIQSGGARWSTNAQGMRDRSYATPKPAATFRIAMVGDSIAAGWGVDHDQGFEPTLERKLDAWSRRAGGPTVEVLNFAVPGHGPGQRWDHFTRVGWTTAPDLVLFEATQADAGWDERRLRGLLPRGIGWDSPLYRDVLEHAGVRPGGTFESYKRALRLYRWEFTAAVYRAVAADCRARGVPCVWALIPRVGKAPDPAEHRQLLALARDAGFAAVVDLTDAYEGIDPNALAIGPNDFHPNAEGHARLARRLDEVLRRQPEIRRLGAAMDAGGDRR